jgi:8-amino-7-oxononanoate synthase
VVLDGREVVCFGSNDYLALAAHPEVVGAAAEAAARWGAGSSGSRLTTGGDAQAEELEAELAALKGAEAAVLFPSGYQAGATTIAALAGPDDLVLSDALNHACLIDGCRLSRAAVRVYRHADAEHAASLLADRDRFRRCLIVTDAVFSMDGDLAPLPALCDLAEHNDAWLMVDDAHGTGVLGPGGAGTAHELGVDTRVDIRMGTLSKALGSQGGFVAGSRALVEVLRSRARGFIFSTAPAPPAVGAALAALGVLRREPERRSRLLALACSARRRLQERGWGVPDGVTPIVPLVTGDAASALQLSARLESGGCWAPAIRPPSEPAGTARLRITFTAGHEEGDLLRLLELLGSRDGPTRE